MDEPKAREADLDDRIRRGLSGRSTSRPPSSKTTDPGLPIVAEIAPSAAPPPSELALVRTELRTMLENIQNAMERRETASVERHTKLGFVVEALAKRIEIVANDHGELRQVVNALEKAFPGVKAAADAAVASHAELDVANQARWKSVMEALDHQNDEAARREREKVAAREAAEEARKQESIAAKRVADRAKSEAEAAASKVAKEAELAAAAVAKAAEVAAAKAKVEAEEREKKRTHREVLWKLVIGAAQAVAIAYVSYLGIQAAHKDTNAKQDATIQQVTALQKKLDTATVVTTAPDGIPANVVASSTVVAFPAPSASAVATARAPRHPAPAAAAAPPATAAAAPP
jgi:hypothetical protein